MPCLARPDPVPPCFAVQRLISLLLANCLDLQDDTLLALGSAYTGTVPPLELPPYETPHLVTSTPAATGRRAKRAAPAADQRKEAAAFDPVVAATIRVRELKEIAEQHWQEYESVKAAAAAANPRKGVQRKSKKELEQEAEEKAETAQRASEAVKAAIHHAEKVRRSAYSLDIIPARSDVEVGHTLSLQSLDLSGCRWLSDRCAACPHLPYPLW